MYLGQRIYAVLLQFKDPYDWSWQWSLKTGRGFQKQIYGILYNYNCALLNCKNSWIRLIEKYNLCIKQSGLWVSNSGSWLSSFLVRFLIHTFWLKKPFRFAIQSYRFGIKVDPYENFQVMKNFELRNDRVPMMISVLFIRKKIWLINSCGIGPATCFTDWPKFWYKKHKKKKNWIRKFLFYFTDLRSMWSF